MHETLTGLSAMGLYKHLLDPLQRKSWSPVDIEIDERLCMLPDGSDLLGAAKVRDSECLDVAMRCTIVAGLCKESHIQFTCHGCISVRRRSAKRVCNRKFVGESFDARHLFAMHPRHKARSRPAG